MTSRVAVVTGGNKGIGLAIVKQLAAKLPPDFVILLTARDESRGKAAAASVDSPRVRFEPLDVTSAPSIAAFVGTLKADHGGRVDVLIHNAGVLFRTTPTPQNTRTLLDVNYWGVRHLQTAVDPLLTRAARVVVVSSSLGDVSTLGSPALRAAITAPDATPADVDAWVTSYQASMDGGRAAADGWPSGDMAPYRVSKMGATALVRALATAQDAPSRDVSYYAVHPGWVATDMGGSAATSTVDQGADTAVWLATGAGGGGKSGTLWGSRKEMNFAGGNL